MNRPITSLQRLSRALLSRGGERVRSTDWWAVAIEIAVVVLGILIAFQLNEWGEDRQARRDERALWQQLEEEARSDIASLAQIRGEHEESATNFRLLARAVADEAAHADYHRRGSTGCNLLRLPAVRRQSSGAIGQAAGARLDLVSDPSLRALIRRAEAAREFSDRQLDFFRASFLRYGEQIEPHMVWRFVGNGTRCGVNIDTLRSHPEAVALLPKMFRDHRRFAQYRKAEQDALADLLARISCLRSGNCAT